MGPTPPKPVICKPPMVKEDPKDPQSKCVKPGEPTPPTPVICKPPMVKEDPKDPQSPCVPPEPTPINPCVPPMVREDPKDPNSKCVKPPSTPENCVPPMVKQNPNDPFSPCHVPNEYKCGDTEIIYRPFIREVNSTIVHIDNHLCSKESMMNDKIEIRGYLKSPKLEFSKKVLSSIEISFMNKKTLEVFKPLVINQTYIVQLAKGKYKIVVNSPYFAKFTYEKNLEKSSCENNIENIITLLEKSKSGVEITMTPVIPIAVGDKVQICNNTQFNPNITLSQKKKFINLRGELIKDLNDEKGKLKLSTNDMKDDVVIYLSGIKDLLKDGHSKLHILTDDGNHHVIDVPDNKDNIKKLVVGQIDKNTKKFKKNKRIK